MSEMGGVFFLEGVERLTGPFSPGLEEMDWQVARLSAALGAPDSWRMLIKAFPELLVARDALTGKNPSVATNALLDLYRHYCEEWSGFRGRQMSQRQAA